MIIYFDESGYTGPDLLNPDQPVFAVASTNLSNDTAVDLVHECFPRARARELKHSQLRKRPRGQAQIIRLLRHVQQNSKDFAVSVYHKEYMLLAMLIDYWIEPAMHADGVNLYERGGNIALCNTMYMVLNSCLPDRQYKTFLCCAQAVLRDTSIENYRAFCNSIQVARQHAAPLDEILSLFVLSDRRLGGYENIRDLPDRITDPGTVHLMEHVVCWSQRTDQLLDIIHDESSKLSRERHAWDALFSPDVSPSVVGQDRRTIRFPLPVRSVKRANSRDHVQLQIADILAGAVAAALRVRAGGDSYRSEYTEKLDETNLLESGIVINAIWPTSLINPEELGTEGEVHGDAATHIARILRQKGIQYPGFGDN